LALEGKVIEDLIELRRMLDGLRDRWLWELEQAEVTRLQGEDQHFLRAKAGYKETQAALDKVEVMLGNATGWHGLFVPQDEVAQ
jgi:hypothetical protein